MGLQEECIRQTFFEFNKQLNGIPGADDLAKLDIVHPRGDRNPRCVLEELGEQDGSGLHRTFTEDYTRDDLLSRIMALKEKLVGLERLAAGDLAFGAFDDLIDEQHRRSVGNRF